MSLRALHFFLGSYNLHVNILFISRNSPYDSVGGVERSISNLIEYHKTQTHTRLFVMLPTSQDSRRETEGNVTICYESPLFLMRGKTYGQKNISEKAQQFMQAVKQIIESEHIDIICAENFHTDLPAAYSLLLNMVALSSNTPLVLQLHSFAATPLQQELINQLRWSQVSCVSRSIAGDCFQKGADINSLSTHYLGVNNEKFRIDPRSTHLLKKELKLGPHARIILTATRIIRGTTNILREKGVINLIQAFSKLSPRYSDLKLLIAIGKPPEDLKEEFNLAYEMLQGYIRLHGVQEHTILKTYRLDEMPHVYQGSDVFALPSENETFGQVFIEAMSCGLPVIGTKVGGIPEIISDSYNGYLIPPDDSSILAQRIEKILNDSTVRDGFIRAGIKTVEQTFTSHSQLSNFLNMLESTAATKN